MQVVGAALRRGEHLRRQHVAVVEREKKIRRDRLQFLHECRRSRILRCLDGKVVLAREVLDAREPDALAGIVAMRDHERDRELVREEHRQAANADVVIREDHRGRGGH